MPFPAPALSCSVAKLAGLVVEEQVGDVGPILPLHPLIPSTAPGAVL